MRGERGRLAQSVGGVELGKGMDWNGGDAWWTARSPTLSVPPRMESTPEAAASTASSPEPAKAPWHARPYVHLWLSILFSAASQPLMKHGSDQVHLAMTAA